MKKQGTSEIYDLVLKADFEAAIDELKAMYAQDPSLKNSVHFYTLFATLEGLINRKEATLRCLAKAKRLQSASGSTGAILLDMTDIRFHVLFHEDKKADELFNLFVETNQKSSMGWAERGVFLYHLEKFGPAGESFELALKHNRNNALALGYKALAQRRMGSPREKESFRDFVMANVPNDVGYLSKAEIYDNLGDYEKVREYAAKVLAKTPSNLAAIFLKRESFIKENKFSLARKYERKLESAGFFIEGFDKLPDDRFYVLWNILFYLEQTRFLRQLGGVPLGDPGSVLHGTATGVSAQEPAGSPLAAEASGSAKRSYSSIQQGNIRMADQYFEKGKKKLEEKDYEEAIKFFNQAVSYDPDHVLALNEMGLTYMMTGDEQGYRIDQAVNYFDEIIRRDPSFAQAHYYKFVAFLLVGNYENAIASIDMAIGLEPGNIQYQLDKGVLLSDIKRNEFAIEVFEGVLKQDPENATAWSSLAFIHKRVGNKKMEVKCLNRFLKLAPKDVNAWFERGMVFKRFAKYDTAISCFDHILSLETDHYLALKEKGMCLRLMGKREEGDEIITRAEQNRERYLKEASRLEDSLIGR